MKLRLYIKNCLKNIFSQLFELHPPSYVSGHDPLECRVLVPVEVEHQPGRKMLGPAGRPDSRHSEKADYSVFMTY